MYNILTGFGIPIKLVKLVKMCLNKVYVIGKNLCDTFPVTNYLKQGCALSPFLLNFDLEYEICKVHENQVGLKLMGDISFLSMLMI